MTAELLVKDAPPTEKIISGWRIVTTAPMSGLANMAYDAETLEAVDRDAQAPTLRFFRWSEATITHGRLQKFEEVQKLVPAGIPIVARPTGGGIVVHDKDLCLSLVWPHGLAPLPAQAKDCYQWIHSVILQALKPLLTVRMAACQDCSADSAEFHSRQCFQEPVAYDLVSDHTKVVGGAIARHRRAFLYQGSIQLPADAHLELAVRRAFQKNLFPR